MDTKSLIEKVVASGVLIKEMTSLPQKGMTESELKAAEERIGVKLDEDLVDFLRTFDGADLDVIRLYHCERLYKSGHGVAFADDPSGFVYHVTSSGEVVSEDTDGGKVKKLTSSVFDFLHSYLFGNRSTEFAGEEWHQQLIRVGIAK